jgi:localization factor PodJL
MKPGVPWSVKGIDPEVRAAAKTAARRAGMTLGEWLNGVILDQNGNNIDSALRQNTYFEESFLSSTPNDTGPSPADSAPRDEQPRRPPAGPPG